ncbi:uncharacterized protein LOC130014052 [Patella vulgata]|uniref:uncharacterized protein LOC130014052 n=1 Tax=Patella vulgata TaxID=6465 RepID=UPI0024A8925E|nr:uncharacterized protein LOC130014052 [Patella vulgata]
MWPVILFMVILLVTGLIGNSLVIAVYTDKPLLNHLFYLNNAVNPFIYAVMNKRFREDLSLLVRKLRRALV